MKHNLFTVNNTKTEKGEKLGYLTLILHLIPSNKNSHGVNLCPYSSPECVKLCLNESGLGDVFPTVQNARKRKTDEFLNDRVAFLKKLIEEIEAYRLKAKKEKLTLCIRLNGTSDIQWSKIKLEGKNIFEHFPTVQFYDYTKNPFIALYSLDQKNYHVTFSWSGENQELCENMLERGLNVAVPFMVKKGNPLPKKFYGYRVIDGDETDLRFLDKKKSIVGLRVKGNKQKKETKHGFIIQIERKK